MKIDYDLLIDKFKRGGADKLQASHELIISIHGYIIYLAYKYHRLLYKHHYDDIVNYCHLHLLNNIYTYDPDKSRFITWARRYILNGLYYYHNTHLKTISLPSRTKENIHIYYLGTPWLKEKIADIDNKLDMESITLKLKKLITKKFNLRYWKLFRDFNGFYTNKLTLSELRIKYNYNCNSTVHAHIIKIRKYLKTKLDELI